MDQDKYITLLYKKQQGTLNDLEQILLDNWLQEAEINRTLAQKVEEEWQLTAKYEPPLQYDVKEEFKALQKRIHVSEQPKKEAAVVEMKRAGNWKAWAAAAVVVLAIGAWWMQQGVISEETLYSSITSDSQKEITLEDGTTIILNDDSKLSYPDKFQPNTRIVRLEGEAFFDVAKDVTKPFIIETKSSNITVLGTSFNVLAPTNGTETEVVVKTGKVKLADNKNTTSVVLVANEKGVHTHSNNTIQKVTEQDMNELAWQTDVLFFKSTPIPEVIESLERLFKTTIVHDATALQACTVTGRFPQPNLDNLLKTVCDEFGITLQNKGGQYELSGGRCE